MWFLNQRLVLQKWLGICESDLYSAQTRQETEHYHVHCRRNKMIRTRWRTKTAGRAAIRRLDEEFGVGVEEGWHSMPEAEREIV